MTTPTGSPSTFSGMGTLEFAPTNNPDDPNPTWVDITVYLRTEDTPLQITRGRQSELDVVQPSTLTCVLDNTDGRFTFGLSSGAYGSNWAPAKKVRYSETILGVQYVLFTGWIEYPDIANWQPIGLQYVQLSATDRLTRLSRGRPFISTLSEHIIFNGGSALGAYWPLNDGSGLATAGGGSFVSTIGQLVQVTSYNDVPRLAQLTWAGTSGPAGDDLSYVKYTPTAATIAANAGFPRLARRDFNVTLIAGQVVAVIGWLYFPSTGTTPSGQVFVSHANGAGIPSFTLTVVPAGVGWKFDYVTSAGSGSVAVPIVKTDSWSIVGMFLDVTAGTVSLYVDNQIATATLGAPSTGALQEVALDAPNLGAWGQVQFYAGPSTTVNRALFTAQYQMGLAGLEQQTTGQRVNTILDYAGVPPTDRVVDAGQSYMQRARLAGQTPGAALANAVGTERGRGFAGGDGRYRFHDRVRIYNV